MRTAGRNWMMVVFLFLGIGAMTAAIAVSPNNTAHRTFSVSITPNGSVPSHQSCHFTANLGGGTAPFHYAWAVNNSPVGDDNQVIVYTNNGSAFRIDVHVTDNNGDTGYDSNIMGIGGSCF